MLPSLSTFTKFEVTHRATRSPPPPPPPPPAPFRTTCASSEHNEQLPSIFELIPELSEGSPRDYHLLPSWHESEPRYYGHRNYYPPPPPTTTTTTTMNTTSTAFNPSSTYSSSKRRRLSIDDGEEEEIRKSREIMDMRSRDILSSPGQWSYFQRTNAPTPDPSPSSRRSSTFSSTETWNGGSPRSNRYTNDSSSPFSRTYAVTPRVVTQFSNEGPAQKIIPLRENSHFPPDLAHDMYAENLCHYNNDDGIATREGETKPRKRRGNLPKDTTDKLRTWFLNHLEHPYPTEDEKQQLMDSTGLQMNQISNWYINARRRQLPAITANARAEAEARRHMQNSKKCEEV